MTHRLSHGKSPVPGLRTGFENLTLELLLVVTNAARMRLAVQRATGGLPRASARCMNHLEFDSSPFLPIEGAPFYFCYMS